MLLNLSKIFHEVLLSNFLIGQEEDCPAVGLNACKAQGCLKHFAN